MCCRSIDITELDESELRPLYNQLLIATDDPCPCLPIDKQQRAIEETVVVMHST